MEDYLQNVCFCFNFDNEDFQNRKIAGKYIEKWWKNGETWQTYEDKLIIRIKIQKRGSLGPNFELEKNNTKLEGLKALRANGHSVY